MTHHRRRLAWLALAAAVVSGGLTRLDAQGVTTAGIGGVITSSSGEGVEGAQVQVVNRATGATQGTLSRTGGYYNVAGLEVGGPYSVVVRRIGFEQATQDNIYLSLGQRLELNFKLVEQAQQIAGVVVESQGEDPVFSPNRRGTQTTVSEEMINRLPTLNRNFTDFVKVAPQVSTSGPGYSGGGVNNRFNNIQIDGASEVDLFGLGSTGQPGGQARGKSISLEAVKEYQVLLSPFDVRHGNFAGLLINAVTKGGTNDFHGSAFYTYRNEKLAQDVAFIRQSAFDQKQFGFSVGGPIVTDKAHFFLAPEFQTQTQPAGGPYEGQGADFQTPFLVSPADLARFQQLMQGYGLNPGSAGLFNAENPTQNLFGRLDFNINDQHRLVVRHNYGHAEWDRLLDRSRTTAQLTSNGYFFESRKNATVAQLYSNFNNGSNNELIAGFTTIRDRRTPNVLSPQISVFVPASSGSGTVTLRAGSEQFSQGNALDQDILELTDNFSMPLGPNHRLTVGARGEKYDVSNLFTRSAYGVYEFASLDDFENGIARQFVIAKNLGGGKPEAEFTVYQLALYAQDDWRLTDRVNITYGLRTDVPFLPDKPRYTSRVESVFGRDTREVPSGNWQISPRVGFNWDLTGDRVNQLRGGAGLFVGQPAFVWVSNAYGNSGSGLVTLTCGRSSSVDPNQAQPFEPDWQNQPVNCANGQGLATGVIGPVNILSDGLKYPQVFRSTLAYDRRLPWDMTGTVEWMYTMGVNNWFYVNRNIQFSGFDRNGRAIYADTIRTNGSVVTKPVSRVFSEVIDVENQSRDFSYNLTGQLEKRFGERAFAKVSYTYARARDVQSLTSSQAISNWRFGRTLSYRHDEKNLRPSLFDQPHRIQATVAYTFPWKTAKTDISFLYSGQSGPPFDYIYGASGGSGDLNGDGFQGNDLIYVPLDATDPSEILFKSTSGVTATPAEQAAAFESFIEKSDCLRRFRGQLMQRNACRSPWENVFDISLRQSLPTIRGQTLALQVDVFNFLNLLNKDWGQQRFAGVNSNVPILFHQGQTGSNGVNGGSAIPLTISQGIFSFDPNYKEFTSDNLASNYQIQLSVRYGF